MVQPIVSPWVSAASKGQYAGTDVTNVEGSLSAGNLAQVETPGTLTLDGGQIVARRVEADVGGLDITSRQDTSEFASSNKSAGVNVSVSMSGQVSGSVNLGKGKQNGEFASVNEQAGIYAGEGWFDIAVKGNTNLVGGVKAERVRIIGARKATPHERRRYENETWLRSATAGGRTGGNAG
ncbi:MAG: hemagglutinin repeat-containing protein [Novosphingobium sp.]|jgi:filamentous hemagglutinin|nr:hemagglutinin repeat-containing protein [Novosphingobium sp.]